MDKISQAVTMAGGNRQRGGMAEISEVNASLTGGKKNNKNNKNNNNNNNNNNQNGGAKETFNFKGGNYTVHTGPRGGKYINHKGSKVYI